MEDSLNKAVQKQETSGINKANTKTKFTPEEDQKLTMLVSLYGKENWEEVSKFMKGRSSRQCKERWFHYLNTEINNGPWTKQEDDLLEEKHRLFGPKWSRITVFFPSRTEINVRNRWLVNKRHKEKTERELLKILAKKRNPKIARMINKKLEENEKLQENMINSPIHDLPSIFQDSNTFDITESFQFI